MSDQPVPAADTVPTFRLPVCFKHFFGSNRWWCRKCQREVARQFEEVYLAFWRSDRRYNELAAKVERQFAALAPPPPPTATTRAAAAATTTTSTGAAKETTCR